MASETTPAEIPPVGSRWKIDGEEYVVRAVHKKGRGYYVTEDAPDYAARRYRLKDFARKAKPLA